MNHLTTAVELFEPQTGQLGDFSQSQFPSVLSAWQNEKITIDCDATHYGYVATGEPEIAYRGRTFRLTSGMYFSIPGDGVVGGEGTGFIASRLGFEGLFQIGGPIESIGRLRYIDGCSDTLLIGPPVIGDPCLNLLRIPPHTNQTSHTHPSQRLGMIAAGRGVCRTLQGDLPLNPGSIFSIDTDAVHSFITFEESLLVIAWHPDSDCGPSHGDHPMINRTIIDGVSAARKNQQLK
jgi:quercetin dioxygenase-like cupin family protein